MKPQNYDLIGDIHGQHGKLAGLLRALGYERQGDALDANWRHPEGRKVIFLGDYIDRGPAIRTTLHTVRAMVESGDALAIMGNHEWNAICFATPDGNGGHFRQHNEKNTRQHQATLDQFAAFPDEWNGWIEWMKELPVALDLDGLRAVHACWDAGKLPVFDAGKLTDDVFLRACATRKTPEYEAIETLLKGPELHLPEGVTYEDKEGITRGALRVRWWHLNESMTLGDLAMPLPMALDRPLRSRHWRVIPNYGPEEPPVFFGHYWFPPDAPREPRAGNVACLDYSAAYGDNKLTAYRWDGEPALDAAKFFTA